MPAPGPSPASGTTGPSPLYNSQVQPYAVLTGPYGYVSAGAALRDQGYGIINLTWPGGSTGNLVAAYLIWAIMNDSVPPATATLNGVNITGTWTAYATPSPCWSATYIYTFVADVTGIVANGINNLTNFPSGITNGLDPWSQNEVDPSDEGASLVAIYTNSSSSAPIQQVTVYTGADTTEGSTLSAQLNYSTTNAVAAKTTYIMEDGQLPGNVAVWNGSVIDTDAFPGSDPKESTSPWSYGNLSDTKTFHVNVTVGSNNTTAGMYPTEGDCLTWVGQVLSVGVPASRGPYPVVFQEQGLPNGVSWNVTTHGVTHSGTVADLTSSISFSLGNGSYTYSVGPLPGYTAPSTGGYKVAGGPVYIRVLFHQLLYPITVNETGLPVDTVWYFELTNTSQALEENLTGWAPGSFAVDEGNGSYNFTTGDTGLYVAEPGKGIITVDGAAVSVTITFVSPPLYNVTFLEQGLPAGTEWGGSVYSNWGDFYPPETSNRSFSLMLPNASFYADSVAPRVVAGYSAPSTVYFGVSGAPETVDVNYTTLFAVYLNETGLPSGTTWYGYINGPSGYLTTESSSATLTFWAENGSYTFDVTPPVWGYTAAPATGTLVVDGAAVTQDIVFTPAPTYLLQFNETGLAPGTSWSVVLDLPNDTQTTQTSTGPTLSFSEPNGSYEFEVSTVAGYLATPSSGYTYVEGATMYVAITFSVVYSVTFTESGLPSGSYWDIYLGDAFGYSYSPTIVFPEPNGTYSFYVYSVDSYTPSPSSGQVDVDGANVTQAIDYTSVYFPTYSVTFTETGLVTPTNWSVDLNDYTESTTGTSLQFTEANGSFDFTVGGATGYTATPSSGLVNVSGAAAIESITFTSPTTGGTFDVTFSESGLPSALTWSVTVNGTTEHLTTNGGTDVLTWTGLPDDTYSYSITDISGWHQTTLPGSGTVEVNGASVTEPTLVYSSGTAETYLVTFSESGLPSGVTWYVNITGQTGLSATVSGSTGTQLTISLTNNSYTFIADSNSKNWTAADGSFSVSGSATSVSVPFITGGPSSNASGSAFPWLGAGVGASVAVLVALLLLFLLLARRRKSTVEFTATGLPNGMSWQVTFDGLTKVSTETAIKFSVSNGTYSFSVTSTGYTATPSNASLTVDGKNLTYPVSFT